MSEHSEIIIRERDLKRRQKQLLDSNKLRICKRCGETLPYSQFSASVNNSHGLKTWCKPCCAEQKREAYYAERALIIEILGGSCVVCHATTGLHLDHIRSDGAVDKQAIGNSKQITRYYIRNPDLAKERLQLMCKPCHAEKTAIERRSAAMGEPRLGMTDDAIRRERELIESKRAGILREIDQRKRGAGQQELTP